MEAIGNGISQAAWHFAWSRVAVAAIDAGLVIFCIVGVVFVARMAIKWLGQSLAKQQEK